MCRRLTKLAGRYYLRQLINPFLPSRPPTSVRFDPQNPGNSIVLSELDG
jgi:hypothetical protein